MPITRITVIESGAESYDQIRVHRPLAWPGMREALWKAGVAVDTKPSAELTLQCLADTDLICFHGLVGPQIFNLLRKMPCPYALWQDDLMRAEHLPPWNPKTITLAQERTLDYMLEHCSAIVATTETLAAELGYPAKTVVQGNLEDFGEAMPEGLPGRMNRAIYVGGSSHAGDLELLNGLEWEGETVIWSSCLPSAKTACVRNKDGTHAIEPNDPKWGWVPCDGNYERYQSGLANLCRTAGVGLAPLVGCRFNAAKSILKVLEYARFGLVPVVSPVAPYLSIPAECCIRCDFEWLFDVARASVHPEIGASAYEWGREHHSYQNHWRRWVSTYEFLAGSLCK